jgi:hypothetical protein
VTTAKIFIHLVVKREKPVSRIFPTIFSGGFERVFYFSRTLLVVPENVADGGEITLNISITKPGVFVIGIRENAAGIGRDDRQARSHRFERRDAERFARVRMNKNITVRVNIRQLFVFGDVTQNFEFAGRNSFQILLQPIFHRSVARNQQAVFTPLRIEIVKSEQRAQY